MKQMPNKELFGQMTIAGILDQKAAIYSMDIYDTVITRTTGSPRGIFDFMQRQLPHFGSSLPPDLIHQFKKIRLTAEQECRQKHDLEITIEEIYEIIQSKYGLSDEMIQALMEKEINLEIENSIGVPEVINLIHQLQDQLSKKVIFISDMYLSSLVMQRLLQTNNLDIPLNHLYVSCDHRITKSTGDLYKRVLAEEGISPADMIHVGNHYQSDYLVPRKIGIRSVYFDRVNPSRIEEKILGFGRSNEKCEFFCEKLTGISKLARVNPPPSIKDTTKYTVGCCVAGPILLGFVLWIIQEAKKRGLRRLYFVSRDGQVLSAIANMLLKRSGQDVEVRYLYGSRQSWLLAGVSSLDDEQCSWIFQRDPIVTLRIIAQRLKIDVSVLSRQLERMEKNPIAPDKTLTNSDLGGLKDVLKSEDVFGIILEKADGCRQQLMNYLKQEKLCDGTSFGVVDLVGTGRLLGTLYKIFQLEGIPYNGSHFYFQLVTRGNFKLQPVDHLAYFNAFDQELPHHKINLNYTGIMELFCMADHGVVNGYREDVSKHWVPILKEKDNVCAKSWGMPDFRAGIMRFIELCKEKDLTELSCNQGIPKNILSQLLCLFVQNPSPEEADIFGRFNFSSDQSETYYYELAPPLNLWKAIFYYTTQFWPNQDKQLLTFWINGSVKRSSIFVKILAKSTLSNYLNKFGYLFYKMYDGKSRN